MSWIPEKYNHIKGTHCWFCDREYATSKCIFSNSKADILLRSREHIIPKYKIIHAVPANYIGACKDCNSLKGGNDAREFALKIDILLKDPTHCMYEYLPIIKKRAWKLYNKTSYLHKHFRKKYSPPQFQRLQNKANDTTSK